MAKDQVLVNSFGENQAQGNAGRRFKNGNN